MCGAGVERGLLYLRFGTNMSLQEVKDFKIESCIESISSKRTIKMDKIKYHCTQYTEDKSKQFIVTLDLKQVDLSKISL